jgi:hypothetical protein
MTARKGYKCNTVTTLPAELSGIIRTFLVILQKGSPNPTFEIRWLSVAPSKAHVFPHLAATLLDSPFHENIKSRPSS